ncbi:MAG TPA: cytidylate kinase-like family protein [Gemmatimonadaceae bacterium]|nr:cytidylate kinase-like family protein [Gemmatimonadaceae bacterium]
MALITISRMYGSGGSEVAERVARALGWQLLDNAFVDAVAARLGVSPAEVQAREERVPTLVQRLADTLALASPEMLAPATEAPLPPSEERMIEVTTRIINEAVMSGHAVLVGRGAQSVLATRSDVLHVFCYAPRSALVARAARRLGVPMKEAERVVDDTNRQRDQYVRKYWKRSWLAHENYHLCLNTEWFGVDGTSELVAQVARERFSESLKLGIPRVGPDGE